MKVARSLLAFLLLCPAAGLAQTKWVADGKGPGCDQLPHGSGASRAPAFFTFMNSEVARLSSGHLLVTPKPSRSDALLDNEAGMVALARRRAAVRILSGYEPVLAYLQELNALRKSKAETS